MQIHPTHHQPMTRAECTLKTKAAELETAFLTEMLRHAGLGMHNGPFGGGAGEEQFTSFLRQAQAEAIVNAGGIGLAEPLFRAMTRSEK